MTLGIYPHRILHNYYFQSSTSFHLSINVLKICISKFLQHSYVFKDFWHLRYTHIEYYQIRRDAKRQYAYTLDKPIHCYFDISSHLDRMTNNIIHFYVQRYHWNPSKGWLAIVRLSYVVFNTFRSSIKFQDHYWIGINFTLNWS